MKSPKSTSINIRVSSDDLTMLKQAAEKLAYSSCSEFIRRTAIIEAKRALEDNPNLTSTNHSQEDSK